MYIEKAKEIDEILTKFQRKLPRLIKKKIVSSKVYFEKKEENIECKVFFEKPNDKALVKLAKNLRDTIVNNEYKNIIIANELKENVIIMDNLQSLNILNGRWLFNYLIYDIIAYILEKKNKDISTSEISFFVNKTTDTNIQNILKIAENAKVLNIITKNISVFKQMEDKIFKETGIMIRVTNNKKRSLLKSDVIINLDYNEEEIIKYNLPSNGIIVNVNKAIKINKLGFNGTNVNNYELELPKIYKRSGFDENEMYESILFCKTQFKNIVDKIKEDNIKIVSLIGNNGIIDEKELM